MADLSKLVLPVKDTTTGEIENQEFNLAGGGGGESFITLEQEATLSCDDYTTVAFYDNRITSNTEVISVITSMVNLSYDRIEILPGAINVIFPVQRSASIISVKIRFL